MGVVKLNCGVLTKRAHVAPLLDVAANEIKQRSGSKEILLSQPQFLARRRRVAWIEDFGDRFGPHALGECADIVASVEGFELQRISRPRRPQAQRVDMTSAPSDDWRVVSHRFDRFARMPDVTGAVLVALDHLDPTAEANRIIVFRTHELPRIPIDEPVLWRFLLPAAADDLAKQAV